MALSKMRFPNPFARRNPQRQSQLLTEGLSAEAEYEKNEDDIADNVLTNNLDETWNSGRKVGFLPLNHQFSSEPVNGCSKQQLHIFILDPALLARQHGNLLSHTTLHLTVLSHSQETILASSTCLYLYLHSALQATPQEPVELTVNLGQNSWVDKVDLTPYQVRQGTG